MFQMSRRSFLALSGYGLGGVITSKGWAFAPETQEPPDELYAQFVNPERKFSARPFWFWNGDMSVDELRAQMEQMIEQGVFGAYAHCRDGMVQPYLSDAWWSIVEGAMNAAEELGFSLCMVDEFEWPSGEARDFSLPGPQKSRVVAANSNFHLKRLKPTEHLVSGEETARIELPPETMYVIAAQITGDRKLDGATIRHVPHQEGTTELKWKAPSGRWVLITYSLELAIGVPDRGTVDLMDRDAVAKYIEIYYEELSKRCGKHFGKALPATFADHEGSYGGRYPWTARFPESFREMHGYEVASLLPALSFDVGEHTEKFRCDFLATVSRLYTDNFFGQVTAWCGKHSLEHSGHIWEESLFLGAAYQGDFFSLLRAMTNPGCDTLLEWARQSAWLKENASVADFERRHVVCENQGVQGENSYLSPERMRRVTNCLGAWNVGEFIPHAFNFDLAKTNYPPDWFRSQPFMPWFKAYADEIRRISFMNRDSHEPATIVLYYPQVSIWGQAEHIFQNDQVREVMHFPSWSEDAQRTESEYALLKLRLTDERLSYQVADDHYLQASRIQGPTMRIGDSAFRVLILPPVSTLPRASAQKIAAFIDAGGHVVAMSKLPTISTDYGRDDPELLSLWQSRFTTNESGGLGSEGRTLITRGLSPELVLHVRSLARQDCEVVDGPTEHLFALRKLKSGREFYWIVNDSAEPRTNLLRLPALGKPEKWDAQTGLRAPLFYQTEKNGTVIRIRLDAWDAAYVVFSTGLPQMLHLESTNMDDLHVTHVSSEAIRVAVTTLPAARGNSVEISQDGRTYTGHIPRPPVAPVTISGKWDVTVNAPNIPVPVCEVLDDPDDQGLRQHWESKPEKNLAWRQHWLSTASVAIREWNVIGPFPNQDDNALGTPFPPESGVNLKASYTGDRGQALRWVAINQTQQTIIPENGNGDIGPVYVRGGVEDRHAFMIDAGTALNLTPMRGTVYAQTFLYSAKARRLKLLLATTAPHAVFLNSRLVRTNWLRPFYYRMTDAFSESFALELQPGWNSVLLKMLYNQTIPTDGHFYCRLAETDEGVVGDVVASNLKYDVASPPPNASYRWVRFPVPPLVNALVRPALQYPAKAFIDGKAVPVDSDIALSSGIKVVLLRVDAREPLATPFLLRTATQPMSLGAWMQPGLEHFSGTMTYEKDLDLTPAMLKHGLLLDCGTVGVVAEAWLNGESIGSRAWSPFVFNMTPHAHVGRNRLRVLVANTEANARAQGADAGILKNIDVDGWEGPARLVPFISEEIVLQPAARI